MQVTVRTLDPEAVRPALEGLGLRWRADVDRDHPPSGVTLEAPELAKLYAQNGPDLRRINCHIRARGRFNQRYALLCRDYLRTHPAAAAAYAEIKRQLARRFPDDEEAYYDVKDPVFDVLMAGAEEWVLRVGWTPGPGDG